MLRHRKALVVALISVGVIVAVSIVVVAWMGTIIVPRRYDDLNIRSVTYYYTPAKAKGMIVTVQNRGTGESFIVEVRADGYTKDLSATKIRVVPGEEMAINCDDFAWEAGTTYEIEIRTALGYSFITMSTAPQT